MPTLNVDTMPKLKVGVVRTLRGQLSALRPGPCSSGMQAAMVPVLRLRRVLFRLGPDSGDSGSLAP